MTSIALLLAGFFGLILLRVNIGFALILSSVFVMLYEDLPLASVANQMYANIDSFALMAVPFFMFLGRILNAGGITQRLLDVAQALVGHIRGGLGHVNVCVSMVFASLSGAAAADTASVGAILIPAMKKAGYDPAFAVALTAASSTLGVIIPPSIILIVYGAFGNVSIGALFLGGILPGVLIGLFMMAYTFFMALRHGYPASPPADVEMLGQTLWRGLPPLLIPVFVLGGVVLGIVTPTEAAIGAVLWALFLTFIAYRALPWRVLPGLLTQSAVDFSVPLFTVAGAGIFGWLISYLGAADLVVAFILSLTTQPHVIMVLLIIFLLLIGTVLNPISAVLIFLPVIQGLGDRAGMDPVHLGVLATVCLSVGLITPPYGICLLIASQIGEVPITRAIGAVLPIVGLVVSVAVLSLWLPGLMLALAQTFLPSAFGFR